MKRPEKKARPIVLVHLLFVLLVAQVPLPGKNETASPALFLCAAVLTEAACLWRIVRGKNAPGRRGYRRRSVSAVQRLGTVGYRAGPGPPHPGAHPRGGVPGLWAQWRLMLRGIGSSLSLLAIGFGIALPLGALLGMLAGWSPRLRGFLVPIARVLAPVPAIIYAPYLIALMPSFRSASALVIILGIFWPTFLQTVGRTAGLDPHILDSARVLCLSDREMVFQISCPPCCPGSSPDCG